MFDSLSLKARLLGSFLSIAAVLLAVALLGLGQLGSLGKETEFVAGPVREGIEYASSAEIDVLDLRRAVLNYALGSPEIKAFETQRMAELDTSFHKAIAAYKVGIFDERERSLVAGIEANYAKLTALSKPILAAADAGDMTQVSTLLEGEHKTVRSALYDDLKTLIKLNSDAGIEAAKDADAVYTRGRLVLIAGSLIGLALAVGLGLWVTRVVLAQLGGDPRYVAGIVKRVVDGDLDVEVRLTRPGDSLLRDMATLRERLRNFYDVQLEMLRQHEAGELDYRIEAKGFSGAYGRMAQAVNDNVGSHIATTRQIIAIMERYAIGDLSQDMPQLPGKKAAITAAMHATKRNLASVNGEIARLVAAASNGDFGVRGDEASYQFAFREMVAGLNQLMDAANRGLNDVGRVLQGLAAGDLTQRVPDGHRGAFGELARDTNHSIDSIRDIVQRISRAVETINTAAQEIASGNSDLSTRTESQAASLEETASSMEELTAAVRANAENSRQAEQVVQSATEGARRSGAVVAEVVQTMDRITQSSRKIGDIIGVIDGIAFQTNILALNAAVEAARAGDQGRGFAVVASEVRSLAQRSAEAAKEIKGLIDSSTRTVDEGARLVGQAGNEINALVDSVGKVTELMRDIAAATEEQHSGIEQVNETVIQLDRSTQQNAALVEEATAAARSLEEQAGGLAEAVQVFRLADSGFGRR